MAVAASCAAHQDVSCVQHLKHLFSTASNGLYMVKFKVRINASDGDAPPATAGSKKLLLCFAAMFVVLSLMVLLAPAKEQDGAAKHYQTMGLKPHASAAEVKKAYRCALTGLLMRQLRPTHRVSDNWHFGCTQTNIPTAQLVNRSSRLLSKREIPPATPRHFFRSKSPINLLI